MPSFRGRGGARGGGRGGSRGGRGGRGGRDNDKLARSGIRTRAGYRKFDSQRLKEVEPSDSEDGDNGGHDEEIADESGSSGEESVHETPTVRAYSQLLQSFQPPDREGGRERKRRKVEVAEDREDTITAAEESESDEVAAGETDEANDEAKEELLVDGDAEESELDAAEDGDEGLADPFDVHFADTSDIGFSRRLKDVQNRDWRHEKQDLAGGGYLKFSMPRSHSSDIMRKPSLQTDDFQLKNRLMSSARKCIGHLDQVQQVVSPYVFNYTDMLLAGRTPQNASSLRNLTCLHAVNHVLKGRDKVIKNNARLSHSTDPDLDLRDQGFTRPKILILLETRQMCFKYAETIADLFGPEQQENKQRFETSFAAPVEDHDTMPEDFRELFEGNNDNNFMTAIKFTRKTLKFYSPFYTSDIILASPLGLRRILENEDPKKRDYDFLSSIEVVIVDQADAMQMQNWGNVESVFQHLNLQLKEAHGCDFSRVRHWCLDGRAKYLRQTLVFSAYITPDINRLFSNDMSNVVGKVKYVPSYADGAIAGLGGLSIKQTFSRFDAASPSADPDARFGYFTSTVLPTILRISRPSDGAKGILVFIPSYYDFLRIRNFFATSTLTQNLSFGTIHDYSDVSAQRRARSHFLSGRHSVLLYTQRAHHFYRLKIRGVKRIVMYGVPDSSIFYEELVGGFLGTSLEDGRLDADELGVRAMFSRWDALSLERVVGSGRVPGMLGGKGDTFDFV